MEDINEALKKIKILVLDCDGVLTDGRIAIDEDGRERKFFHVYDGAGIRMLSKVGIGTAIISGRISPCTSIRAKDLNIDEVYQGAEDKLPVFNELLAKHGLLPEQVAYIGDDLMDMPILKQVGVSITVADASKEIKENVDYVCERSGGHGAVREVIELILKAQGHWDKILMQYGVKTCL